MGMLAWIFGSLGGLCMLMGIVTVLEVLPPVVTQFTPMFWMVLSAVLLLICIAFALGRGAGYE